MAKTGRITKERPNGRARKELNNTQIFVRLRDAIKDVACARCTYNDFADMLNDALNQGYPIDFVPDLIYTRSLLCLAIKEYHTYDIAEHLIDIGADVNVKDPFFLEMPLLSLITNNDPLSMVPKSLVQKIFSKTQNLEEKDRNSYTPLERLCIDYMSSGEDIYKENIKQLIRYGAKPEIDEAMLEALLDEPDLNEYLGYDQALENFREIKTYLNHVKEIKQELSAETEAGYDYEL